MAFFGLLTRRSANLCEQMKMESKLSSSDNPQALVEIVGKLSELTHDSSATSERTPTLNATSEKTPTITSDIDTEVDQATLPPSPSTTWQSALISTVASLAIVLTLLTAVRFLLPPLLESARYSWFRGKMRAEHDSATETLNSIRYDGLSQISEAVSRRVTPSVVHVDVRQHGDAKQQSLAKLMQSDEFSKHFPIGQGSGVIVDEGGFILTNQHVLEDAEIVEVQLCDKRRVRAEIIGTDAETDLAVLKIDAEDLIPIEWGDSDTITVGSSVWAVGSPFGLTGSITFGIISSKNRIDLTGTKYQSSNVVSPRYGDLLQSDVAVNPGNSGGPLVDYQGKLIGINTAILGESYRGVSFSIPSHVVRRCYDEIRLHGSVARGWLGVELDVVRAADNMLSNDELKSDPTSKQVTPGAVVLRFASGGPSPAKQAGLLIDDRIIEFNGVKITDATHLIRLIGESTSGTSIPFKVIRDEKELSLNVVLGRRPNKVP
jgi:serine protease Do